MPRPTKGPRLGGSAQHERHMLANLATQLFIHESITTTEARARRLRPYAEKLITKGKRGDLHARRTVMKKVTDKYAVYRLFEELAPQFEGREGGYTRIVKTAPRKGDNAPMAVISLVLEPVAKKEVVADAVATAKRAAEKAVRDAEEAARAAHAHDFITQMPDGYDTAVGERGGTLSGGQRQRIAIARALLRDSPIVIMDEATTGLDPASTSAVLEAIDELVAGRTTLTVTHDPQAAMRADRVVWIQEGRIWLEGNPQYLMETSDEFRRWANSHMSDFLALEGSGA